MAQLFVKTKSQIVDIYGIHITKQFVNCFQNVIY